MTFSANTDSELRQRIIYFIVVGFICLFSIQLFNMQIFKNEIYNEKSAENSIKGIVQIPLRGVFYDRNYKLLVANKPSFTLLVTPSHYDRKLDKLIENVLGVEPGFIGKILSKNSIYSKYIPIRIQRDVDFKVIAWVEENSEKLPGVSYTVELERAYQDSIKGSHLFGYIKEVGKKQLDEDNYYDMGDFIGYTGIEKTYEKYLRGQKGMKYILVDSKRKEIGRFNGGADDINSIKGDDLVLTIDEDLQRIAENGFEGKSGALVAIEPKTGEILAFVSAPQYNLNDFTTVTSKDIWSELNNDPSKPLFNRATQSINPPGSTIKIMEAIAALEEGIITPQTTFYCGGGFYFGRFFKCHGGNHGSLNVVHAIEHSCNSFFYQLILKMGLEKWNEYGRKFGFGQKTGIDLSEEKAGILPSAEYYDKRYGKNGWTKGFIVSLGIGQGELSVTPLQLANYVSLVANNGRSFTPHLVKGYLDDNKKLVPFKFPEVDTKISQKTMDIVKEGMFLVVNGSGTATSVRLPDVHVAGKTGTAQNPHGKDHAWFMGFAPYEDPKIAVAAFVENAGFGATWAAPIAKAVIQEYMKKLKISQKNNIQQSEENVISASLKN